MILVRCWLAIVNHFFIRVLEPQLCSCEATLFRFVTRFTRVGILIQGPGFLVRYWLTALNYFLFNFCSRNFVLMKLHYFGLQLGLNSRSGCSREVLVNDSELCFPFYSMFLPIVTLSDGLFLKKCKRLESEISTLSLFKFSICAI